MFDLGFTAASYETVFYRNRAYRFPGGLPDKVLVNPAAPLVPHTVEVIAATRPGQVYADGGTVYVLSPAVAKHAFGIWFAP